MYIIIAGCGRLGTELAMRFSDQGHDVVMIDPDPERLKSLGFGFNGLSVTGMPFDEDVLQKAGIAQTDVIMAVTDDDNVNIMISQISRVLYHIPQVLTRISAPDKVNTFQKMGFDVICPTIVAADRVEHWLKQAREAKV